MLGRGATELGVGIVTSFAATLCVLTGPACDKTEIPGTEEGKVGAGVETE